MRKWLPWRRQPRPRRPAPMNISAEALAAIGAPSRRDERPAILFAQSPELAMFQAEAAQRRAMALAEQGKRR